MPTQTAIEVLNSEKKSNQMAPTAAKGNPSMTINVYRSSSTWTESGITFNNKPAAGQTLRGSFTVSGTTNKTYEVDLTSFLKAEFAAGQRVVTLVLKGAARTSAFATFASDEVTGGPQLIVT